MTKRVGVIFAFFGQLPWYFSYFIQSCRYNPEFDFIIFSDAQVGMELPPNIHFHKMTLDQLGDLADARLQLKTNLLPKPYKLCDLRPAFGYIFEEFIKDYDFWGHGDIDVIFGKISRFIDDDVLSCYDIVSMRHDYVSSWFALYRNCERVNNLFRLSKDYEKVFTTGRYFNFDETNLTFSQFSDGIPWHRIGSEVESITHVVRKLQSEHYITAYFNMHAIEGLTGRLKWTEGRLLFKGQFEIVLYHLLQFKKIYTPKAVPEKIPASFNISSSRIYTND